MLVLTRKVGQSIMIGDEVRITILSIKGSQVRIAIEAPQEVPVFREEVYKRIIEKQNKDNSALTNTG